MSLSFPAATRGTLLLALVLTAAPALAQDPAEVEIVTVRVTDSVYMLVGQGGNIGLSVGEDGAFLVDDQFAPLTDKISAAVGAVTDRRVRFVLNTHFHYDHTDGNEAWGEAGAMIVSHDNSRLRMSEDQVIAFFNHQQEAYDEVGLPVITFSESMTFHWNGDTIEVLHPPNAHTDGDAFVFFREANVLHMGDVFVRYGLPFIDEPNGGTIDGLIAGVQMAIDASNDQTKVIPGHGELATRADMIAFNDMLRVIRDRVGALVNAGASLEDVLASEPTRGYDVGGIPAEAFVSVVYANLSAMD